MVLAIIGILSLLGAYAFGYWQGKTAQRTLDLNIIKATPKIGTSMRIDKRQENPNGFPPFYYLIATIDNEGELPAQQLQGYYRVYSETKCVKEHRIPIEREFLGSSAPSELELCRLEDGISGTTLNLAPDAANIRFNVDIEFHYLGVQNSASQKYCAHYEYDKESRQMKRKELNDGTTPNKHV